MIVPFGKSQQQANGPAQRPSETDLLLALAEMHRQGRFAKLDTRDPEAGFEADEKTHVDLLLRDTPRELRQTSEPKDFEREMEPGEDIPDRTLGVRSGRTVKGI
jgi:hypothetical protein